MDNLSSSQLKAILEDTQASLAAALGRIEAFRIREKQLMNELSALRQQVHGGATDPQWTTSRPSGGARTAAASPAPGSAPQIATQSVEEPPRPKASEVAPSWTSPSSQPVYVTNCEGDYPIHIISGFKKIPGSLVVTAEYVDFVEIKARVRQEEFVGISTVKADASPKRNPAFSDGDGVAPDGTSGDDVGCKEERASGDGGGDGASTSGGGTGVWQILWSKNGVPQRQAFEASRATREALHRHTQRWLGEDTGPGEPSGAGETGEMEIAVPRNLTIGEATLRLVGEPSVILNDAQMRALASAIPPLERMKDWTLSYSTLKHGISLQTLYRKAQAGQPTILLIRDFGGYTFGCYTPDSWRIAPRYYGSGETFVFQLEPYRVAYPWRSLSKLKNDFFQFGTPECLAVGGLGHFAIWVDAELLAGSSGTCGTFGSPCLATGEEFKVQHVEMWQATGC